MVHFFGPPKTQSYYNPHSQIRSHPVLRHGKEKDKETENENGEADSGDSKSNNENEKHHLPPKGKHRKSKDEPETETEVNTRLNALLYHTSNETVDLYKQENNSSDLLGRLYYDDYDSDILSSPDAASPITQSPNGSATHMPDYFSSRLGHNPAASPSINAALLSPSTPSSMSPTLLGSHSSSALGSLSTPGARVRPEMKRIKSFERGISFDTSTDDHRKSLTFKVKHPHFRFRRNNKTFLAGFNNSTESLKAIEWLFDEMIVHGDTVIILHVLDEKYHEFIDKREANKALNKIELLNMHFKKVSLVFEVVIGKPQKLLKKAIDEYSPAMMIVGTSHYGEKGSSHSKIFSSKSSMSKHFLECALVPVIVVKPTYNYVELLPLAIESELYFQDLLGSIDISGTYLKEKNKRKSKLNIVSSLSPSSSRSSSYTDISSLANSERGRHVVSTKDNQPFKRDVEDRGRQETTTNKDEVPKFSISDSRSRSRSTSKSRDFSRLFSRHH